MWLVIWLLTSCLPFPLQGYDPLDISLADALQVLASKQRWSTSKKDRKAVAAAVVEADAADVAAAAEEPAKRARGRPRKTPGMESAAEAAGPEADSRHQAALAGVEARLALDAAANLEIDQLKDALKYSPEEAQEAERMAAALSKLHGNRGQSGFNIFVMGAGRGKAAGNGCCSRGGMPGRVFTGYCEQPRAPWKLHKCLVTRAVAALPAVCPPRTAPASQRVAAKAKERREAGEVSDGQGSVAKHLAVNWQALSAEEKESYNREARQQK